MSEELQGNQERAEDLWPEPPAEPMRIPASVAPESMTSDLEKHLRTLDPITLSKEKTIAMVVARICTAERIRLEILVRKGELLVKSEVERARLSRIVVMRDLMLSIPAKVSPRLSMKSGAAIETILREEIRSALSELASPQGHGLIFFDQELYDELDAVAARARARQEPKRAKVAEPPTESIQSLVDEVRKLEEEA